jgi:hypothetical protein
LRDLEKVAAGVIEDSGDNWTEVGGRLYKLHAFRKERAMRRVDIRNSE